MAQFLASPGGGVHKHKQSRQDKGILLSLHKMPLHSKVAHVLGNFMPHCTFCKQTGTTANVKQLALSATDCHAKQQLCYYVTHENTLVIMCSVRDMDAGNCFQF